MAQNKLSIDDQVKEFNQYLGEMIKDIQEVNENIKTKKAESIEKEYRLPDGDIINISYKTKRKLK